MSTQELLSFTSLAIVSGCAIWVLLDARRIGVVKGRFTGLANMGPWGWCIACFFLWIITFPLYVVKRRELLEDNEENRKSRQAGTAVGAGVYVLELLLMAVLLFGHPKESTAQLAAQVHQSIVKKFASNPMLAQLRVGELELVHDSGNKYQGLLKVSAGGETSNIEVHVTYDGRSFMWHIAR